MSNAVVRCVGHFTVLQIAVVQTRCGEGSIREDRRGLVGKRMLAHTVSDVDEFRSERCVIHKALAFTPGDLLASHPLVPLSVLGFGLWARWECWMPPCRCDGHAKALRNLGLKMG